MSPNSRLSEAWASLDKENASSVVPLIDVLDELAKTLAKDEAFR